MTDIKQYQPTIDWLSYISYESNRATNPEVPFESWRKMYINADIFEEIFEKHQDKIMEKCKCLR